MTVSARVTVQHGQATYDLVLDIDDGATGADVSSALADVGLRAGALAVDGRMLAPGRPVESHPLLDGSRIELTSATPTAVPSDVPHVVVVSGPEAGAWFPLRQGRPLRVGRADCEIALTRDSVLSKQHARFDFDGRTTYVSDLGSSNGTFVEGRAIAGPTEVADGTFVHVGSSVLAVVPVGTQDRAVLGSAHEATFPFPRTFRSAREPLLAEHRLPRRPTEAESTAGSWWRSLLPLVTGVGFAVMTGRWWFLAITALAPVIYAGDAVRQKRGRRRRLAADIAQFERDAGAVRSAAWAVSREELRRRRTDYPVGGTANVLAMVRHRRLWERRPSDHDFLSVAFGLAERPSEAFLIEQAGETAKEHLPMWGYPVAVDLVATGSIAILGDRQRARAVLRGLLMGLAVTHAPSEVVVWILAADGSATEWAPMRWLPHVSEGGGTCRIASTAADRSAAMSRLRQIIDARAEAHRASNDPLPVPAHVVVVDGVDLLPPSDLSAMLVEGRAAGVFGIVADPSVAPEGTMGTLQLGAAADEARFVSRLQPLIAGVLTAEMPAKWAETGARMLAALRPSTTGRAALAVNSERLAKMVNAQATGSAELARAWRDAGSRTRVVVGTASDATFMMDIVRDGPHGLVGGMTRSGKTEFLKTLITSLAWANHPDDLNFVIVDFKGGIDYTVAKRLPHVLDLSSNHDLSGFERTVQLLTAEQRRRQTIFESVEVSNLDAYRVARSRRVDLPPIPRLIVLIDEFGELLASDEGRDQLSRIESISRIGGGLGINLLLITQNFEGQLPAQIAANAGLRVCFRVQEPANSKVVLDTPIAASIPATAPGRGYARLKGSDPLEFQSARVAGRRPELRGAERVVRARIQPFEMLPHAGPLVDLTDVPAEETDMFAMIETVTDAARISGWARPAVPWPSTLPADIELAEVLGSSHSGEVRVGRADVPEQQRQVEFALRPSDEHVALLGGPRADLNTALLTAAFSAAVTNSPDDLHIYGIDFSGRGLARIAQLPHCGGVASRNDPLAVRIARRLVDEMSLRRSELNAEGVATLDELAERTGRRFPHILVLVAGAEKLSSIASSDDQSAAAAPLATLLSEGTGLGVQVIAAGLPSFAHHRPGSYIDRRLVFEASDMSEYVALGCPRTLVPEIRGPRRGVDTASKLVVQWCSLGGGTVNEADVVDALSARIRARWDGAQLERPPLVVNEVVWPTPLWTLAGTLRDRPERIERPLLLGVDNASGEPVWVDATDLGGTMLVAGGRKSGRSSTLVSLGLVARHLGWDVVGVAPSPTSLLNEPDCPFDVVPIELLDKRLADADDHTMLVIDDINRLENAGDSWVPQRLGDVGLVVLAGPPSTFSGLQRPITDVGLRRATAGIVLKPEGHADADLVGAKLDHVRSGVGAHRRPGQGLFGASGEIIDITVGHAS